MYKIKDIKNKILCGDALSELKKLPDESIDCVITSPPYWGLRDYGVDGQLGLEKTPEEYVAKMVEVFREVKRILKKEGTFWLNLGDSYGANNNRNGLSNSTIGSGKKSIAKNITFDIQTGLKPKDLVGIPWRVAFALQQPYYSGKIKDEKDRIWLAAIIDGEGCIFIHKRKAGQNNGQGYERKNDTYSPCLEVANTHESIIKHCLDVVREGTITHQDKENKYKQRNQRLFRWHLRSEQTRILLQEIYPYLVAKKQEARLAIGCPTNGDKAKEAHESYGIT